MSDKCEECGTTINVQDGVCGDFRCREAKGSDASTCSSGLTNEAFTKFYQHVKDPNNGWIDLGVAKAKSQQEPPTEDKGKQP